MVKICDAVNVFTNINTVFSAIQDTFSQMTQDLTNSLADC
jgi:hypothetical protein